MPDMKTVDRPTERFRLRTAYFDEVTAAAGAETVAEKGRLVGVPERTLFRLRRGRQPSLATAMQIARALKLPMGALFDTVIDQ